MNDELRDADGCEDYESQEESGMLGEETAEDEIPAEGEDELPEETEDADENPAQKALSEANDKYMRLFAEFDNFRKRTAREKSETYQDAVAKTVLELLPAIDSFERAMESPCSDEAYRTGMEKIYQQFTAILAKLGVTEIPAMNETFDPKVHNAIRQVEDENFGESTVCEVYQKGYMLGSRLIRCAVVSVAN